MVASVAYDPVEAFLGVRAPADNRDNVVGHQGEACRRHGGRSREVVREKAWAEAEREATLTLGDASRVLLDRSGVNRAGDGSASEDLLLHRRVA